MSDIIKNIASFISQDAPLLATALCSPVSGIVVSLISSIFGDSSKDPQNLLNIINSDKDALIKIKELESSHEEELKKINATIYQTQVNDVISARKRETDGEKDTGKRDWIVGTIAIIVVIGFLSMPILEATKLINPNDNHLFSVFIGQLTSAFVMVLSFYFGSTYQSK